MEKARLDAILLAGWLAQEVVLVRELASSQKPNHLMCDAIYSLYMNTKANARARIFPPHTHLHNSFPDQTRTESEAKTKTLKLKRLNYTEKGSSSKSCLPPYSSS